MPQKELEQYIVNPERGTINEIVDGRVVLRLRINPDAQWRDGALAAILSKKPIRVEFGEFYTGVDGVMEAAIKRLSPKKHPQ